MRGVFGGAPAALALLLVTLAGAAPAAAQAKVGDVVFAQWRPNNWYHGKVDATCPLGLHIAFDDGDEVCVHPSLVAVDAAPADPKALKPGLRVLARWSDERFYPATVKLVAPEGVAVGFDDRAERTLQAAELRLLPAVSPPRQPAAGDVVWAQWKPNSWYRGKAGQACTLGLDVAFEDGDAGCYPPALIVPDTPPTEAPKVGTRVLAIWGDGKFYPATVTEAGPEAFGVRFDDGATSKVALKDLRLLAR